MKRTIEWHEQCLFNMQASLAREQESLSRMIANVDRIKSSVNFYSQQIQEAKEKKKDGFDSDKFGKKKGNVPNESCTP